MRGPWVSSVEDRADLIERHGHENIWWIWLNINASFLDMNISCLSPEIISQGQLLEVRGHDPHLEMSTRCAVHEPLRAACISDLQVVWQLSGQQLPSESFASELECVHFRRWPRSQARYSLQDGTPGWARPKAEGRAGEITFWEMAIIVGPILHQSVRRPPCADRGATPPQHPSLLLVCQASLVHFLQQQHQVHQSSWLQAMMHSNEAPHSATCLKCSFSPDIIEATVNISLTSTISPQCMQFILTVPNRPRKQCVPLSVGFTPWGMMIPSKEI